MLLADLSNGLTKAARRNLYEPFIGGRKRQLFANRFLNMKRGKIFFRSAAGAWTRCHEALAWLLTSRTSATQLLIRK
jgi:hypothetical protein